MIYLPTDGFEDQFGGPSGKKYQRKRLKENLISLCDKNLDIQRTELEKNIYGLEGKPRAN